MRKILFFPRNGVATMRAAIRHVTLAALGASLTVSFCCSSDATAQSHANYVTPAAAMNYQNAPVSGNLTPSLSRLSASDAGYSVADDTSQVTPASYGSSFGGYGPGSSYGGAACDTPGYNVNAYASAEALWMRRGGDKYFSLSQNSYMPDFDYELGGRFTVGRLFNSVDGWEGVYTGPFKWNRQSIVDGAGNLQSRLVANGGYTPAEINTFNNANRHIQAWESKLNSFELNRRWWSWDVLSTLIGVRYVDYNEDYVFQSITGGGVGTYRNQVKNRMAGAQIGADLLYPVSLRTNMGFRGKAGVYANFDETSVHLQNGATTILNSGDNSVDLAGLIEMGVFANYQVVPSVRLTAGYEFWYMPGAVTLPGQNPQIINPSTGTRVENDDEVILHGGSVGVQVLF